MFYALDDRIEDVRKIYQAMIDYMKTSRGVGQPGRNGVFLRFICDLEARMKTKRKICELVFTRKRKSAPNLTHSSGDTEAMTTNIQQNKIIEENYAFDDAASIVFCPPFFDDAKYPSTTDLEKNRPQTCNLDKVQSRGKP